MTLIITPPRKSGRAHQMYIMARTHKTWNIWWWTPELYDAPLFHSQVPILRITLCNSISSAAAAEYDFSYIIWNNATLSIKLYVMHGVMLGEHERTLGLYSRDKSVSRHIYLRRTYTTLPADFLRLISRHEKIPPFWFSHRLGTRTIAGVILHPLTLDLDYSPRSLFSACFEHCGRPASAAHELFYVLGSDEFVGFSHALTYLRRCAPV